MAEAVRFQDVAREWWERNMLRGNLEYAEESWRRLEREAMPKLGDKPLKKITAPMVLTILRRIEKRGALVTARKVKSHISQIMRYGIACRHVNKYRSKKRRCFLKLEALTFVRPGELCRAEWTEIEWDSATWRIPAEKMKMKRPHSVPLSRQAMDVLRELRAVTGDTRWLFPSRWDHSRHEEGRVLNTALRRMGYGPETMAAHGFRAMAATTLSEQGWPSEAIERQLAHVDKNQVRAAYQRSDLLTERRKMMQAWADYLDMPQAWAILGR